MCESFEQIGTKRLMCGANLHHPPFLYQSLELPVPHSWKLPGYNSGLIALWTNRRRSEAVVSSSSVLWNQPCSWHRSEAATWLQNTPSGFSNYKKKNVGRCFTGTSLISIKWACDLSGCLIRARITSLFIQAPSCDLVIRVIIDLAFICYYWSKSLLTISCSFHLFVDWVEEKTFSTLHPYTEKQTPVYSKLLWSRFYHCGCDVSYLFRCSSPHITVLISSCWQFLLCTKLCKLFLLFWTVSPCFTSNSLKFIVIVHF